MAEQASVAQVRSYDQHVHLTLDNGTAGWCLPDDSAHGIAAAAQASDVKLWVTYTSYDPNTLGGFFNGVQFALQDW